MLKEIKEIVILGIIFILIDAIYLKLMSSHFNTLVTNIQNQEQMEFRIFPAILCYIFLIIGLQYFIISKEQSVMDAAILGWVIYGVYETTNAAIFKKWDYFSLTIDTIWVEYYFHLLHLFIDNYLASKIW